MPDMHMGWLWWVDPLKLQVSFAKEPYKRDDILQKRPVISRSQLIVATPYPFVLRRCLTCISIRFLRCIPPRSAQPWNLSNLFSLQTVTPIHVAPAVWLGLHWKVYLYIYMSIQYIFVHIRTCICVCRGCAARQGERVSRTHTYEFALYIHVSIYFMNIHCIFICVCTGYSFTL